jgi:hypothetical protein
MLNKLLLAFWILLAAGHVHAIEVPRSNLIIHVGMNNMYLSPVKDTAVDHFRVSFPGLYAKFSGESFSNAVDFVHFDLNLSLNKAVMTNGYGKISRLCFNYGFGKCYERVKFTLSPGLCYSIVGYENQLNKRSILESRFAPSLALQVDLILIKTNYQYLGLFIEGSAMIAKPSRWVHQLAFGISWKPSFRKEDKTAGML